MQHFSMQAGAPAEASMKDYEIQKCIGGGAFGRAFLARSLQDGQLVVIKKILLAGLKPEDQEKAYSESELLASLRHPNIVSYKETFMESAPTGESLCIVMQYCEGGDLHSLIKARKAEGRHFTEDEILNWIVQILSALQYIHERKILHRDLKTKNLFLTKNARVIKIGDFGIAKVLDGSMEMALTAVGTPYYLSPEVCQNKPYSYKSDVWALGCILQELCALRHPFDATNMFAILYKIMQGTMPPLPDEYSEELKEVACKMLQRDPEERPTVYAILRMSVMERAALRLKESNLSASLVSEAFRSMRTEQGLVAPLRRKLKARPRRAGPAATSGAPAAAVSGAHRTLRKGVRELIVTDDRDAFGASGVLPGGTAGAGGIAGFVSTMTGGIPAGALASTGEGIPLTIQEEGPSLVPSIRKDYADVDVTGLEVVGQQRALAERQPSRKLSRTTPSRPQPPSPSRRKPTPEQGGPSSHPPSPASKVAPAADGSHHPPSPSHHPATSPSKRPTSVPPGKAPPSSSSSRRGELPSPGKALGSSPSRGKLDKWHSSGTLHEREREREPLRERERDPHPAQDLDLPPLGASPPAFPHDSPIAQTPSAAGPRTPYTFSAQPRAASGSSRQGSAGSSRQPSAGPPARAAATRGPRAGRPRQRGPSSAGRTRPGPAAASTPGSAAGAGVNFAAQQRAAAAAAAGSAGAVHQLELDAARLGLGRGAIDGAVTLPSARRHTRITGEDSEQCLYEDTMNLKPRSLLSHFPPLRSARGEAPGGHAHAHGEAGKGRDGAAAAEPDATEVEEDEFTLTFYEDDFEPAEEEHEHDSDEQEKRELSEAASALAQQMERRLAAAPPPAPPSRPRPRAPCAPPAPAPPPPRSAPRGVAAASPRAPRAAERRAAEMRQIFTGKARQLRSYFERELGRETFAAVCSLLGEASAESGIVGLNSGHASRSESGLLRALAPLNLADRFTSEQCMLLEQFVLYDNLSRGP
eukprot:tig00021127_g18738.t1